jgi:hypothetical protein
MATRGGVRPVRAVLGVAESRLLVRSIETADTTHVARFCLPQRPATTRVLAFVPLTSSGARLPTVAATIEDPPCDLQVSNGTDVRYNWTPPPSLLRRLEALRPTAVVAPPTPNPVTTTPR